MLVVIIIAGALAMVVATVCVAFALHGRIAVLEENADAVAALREELAGLLAAVDERECEITQQVDECARLAQSTADQRLALYKMTKAINRDVARWAHESRDEANRTLEEAARANAQAQEARERVDRFEQDHRVQRLLNKQGTS
jgi:hypothetical protein